jgi:hypothetical protein
MLGWLFHTILKEPWKGLVIDVVVLLEIGLIPSVMEMGGVAAPHLAEFKTILGFLDGK